MPSQIRRRPLPKRSRWWVVPVILTALPACAFAQSPGSPTERRIDPAAVRVSVGAHTATVKIPVGDDPIGDPDGRRSARPAHQITLSAFAIDRTEVTNPAFAGYLNALGLEVRRPFPATEASRGDFGAETWPHLLEQGRAEGLYPIIGLDDRQVRIGYRNGAFRPAEGYADHPVAETTWRGARDYCGWRGARLPTEAEWEGADRATAGLTSPWGEAPPNDARLDAGHPSSKTAPVGAKPTGATPRGRQDMAGSLAEWTASLVRPDPDEPSHGRNDRAAAGERITRGGDDVFGTAPRQLTPICATAPPGRRRTVTGTSGSAARTTPADRRPSPVGASEGQLEPPGAYRGDHRSLLARNARALFGFALIIFPTQRRSPSNTH